MAAPASASSDPNRPAAPAPSPGVARYLPSHLGERLNDPAAGAEIERHLQALLRTVMTYLPRRLLHTLSTHPAPGRVWGEAVEGTLLFADLTGFTNLAASLSRHGLAGAEQLVTIVNAIFTTMLEIIEREGGDLLVFGGDALLVLFDGPAHAPAAVRAAMQLQEAMATFRHVDTAEGPFSLRMHIGINSGRFLAASVGRPQAMQYILLGRVVEEAAQAETLAAAGEIVVGEATARQVQAWCPGQPLAGPWVRLPAEGPLPPAGPQHQAVTWDPDSDVVARLNRLVPYLPAGLLERLVPYPTEPTVEADLKPVAVLFANLLGFEIVLDTLGPEGTDQAVSLLQQYIVTMQSVVGRYEGTLNKMDISQRGGKLLVLFGAPIKHEDDAERAARAALDMQQEIDALAPILAQDDLPPLRQRIGLHLGDVFAGNVGSSWRKEYTVMGSPVNLAARVMAAAEPGQIWATTMLCERVGPQVRRGAPFQIEVKGWDAPLPLQHILGLQAAHRPAPSRALVGREEERERLRQALRETRQGEGHLVSVVGEAGIGKSRLVEETITLAGKQGFRVMIAHTPPYGERVPYTPWAELLRALLQWTDDMTAKERAAHLRRRLAALSSDLEAWAPVVAEALGLGMPETTLTADLAPRLRRQRLFDLTLQWVQAEAAETPLLLILEDLQWAGPPASELLAYIGRNIAQSPVMIVDTYRPVATPFPWEGIPHHQEIRLQPLPTDRTGDLVATLTGCSSLEPALASLIWERAQGNPLFVKEIVQALREQGALSWQEGRVQLRESSARARREIPRTVQEVILSRIDRLREEVRSVLRVASVIDQEFPFPVLQGVFPYDDPEAVLRGRVQHLCQVDMLMPAGPDRYAFRHALAREVAYQSILHARRQVLHERVGRYYEQHFAGQLPQYYGFLAHHYQHSASLPKAIEYTVKAGRQAAHTYANETAAAYFEQALEMAEGAPGALAPRETVRILQERGDVLRQAGRFDEALSSYEQALERGRHILDEAEIAQLYRLCGQVHEFCGRYDEDLDVLQKAHRILLRHPQGHSSLEMARVLIAMSAVHLRTSAYERATHAAQEALAIARQAPEGTGRSELLGQAYVRLGDLATMTGRYQEAQRYFETGLHYHEQAGQRRDIAITYNNLGYLWQLQDEYQQAIESHLRCMEVAERMGDPYIAAYAANNLGAAWYELGDYALARTYCQESLNVRKRIGDQAGIASSWDTLGLIHAAQGEYSEALKLHRDSLELKRTLGDTFQEANSLINIALSHHGRGEFQAALSLGREALRVLQELGTQSLLDEAHGVVAESLLAMGQSPEAREHAEAAMEVAAGTGGRKHGAVAARVLAEALAADPQADPAEITSLFETAIETLGTLNCRLEWARASYAYGRFLRSQGRVEEARDYLEEARRLFSEIGAPWLGNEAA